MRWKHWPPEAKFRPSSIYSTIKLPRSLANIVYQEGVVHSRSLSCIIKPNSETLEREGTDDKITWKDTGGGVGVSPRSRDKKQVWCLYNRSGNVFSIPGTRSSQDMKLFVHLFSVPLLVHQLYPECSVFSETTEQTEHYPTRLQPYNRARMTRIRTPTGRSKDTPRLCSQVCQMRSLVHSNRYAHTVHTVPLFSHFELVTTVSSSNEIL